MSAPSSSDRQGKTKITIKRRQTSAQYFTEKLRGKVGMQMMLILGGEFIMGTPETELDSTDEERPQHRVNVPTFFMGKYPVTQEQWQTIMGNNPSRFKGNKRPVESVSWNDAKEFCNKLSDKTKHQYRLPSEAEWEYACRAGTTTPYHFGDTITRDLANYNNSETISVDKFGIANDFGLCDMHGNVWEWCEDDWHENYQDAPTDGSAWLSKSSNTKVLRGGSWDYFPDCCRSASRITFSPEKVDFNIGFRVVCEVPTLFNFGTERCFFNIQK